MMRVLTLLCVGLLVTASASGQCVSTSTGNNASVLVDKAAYRSLHVGERVRVYADDLCVGERIILADNTGSAIPVTAWGDDEITPEVDGATIGSLLTLSIEKPSTTTLLNTEGFLADDLTYAPDRVYHVVSAEFDTTTTRLINELNADIDRIGAELDTAYVIADYLAAQGDSLQTVVDAQHANITDLQYQLAAADARADSLQAIIDSTPDCTQCQSDLNAARAEIDRLNAEVAELNTQLVAALDKLRQIEYVANGNKGRYRAILDILNQ